MPSYEYRPLKKGEIRILILSPSTGTNCVECTLEPVRLSDRTDFEALSYCWGSSNNRGRVHCAGNTLHVTPNLFSALRHLAHSDRKRRLWVDAICINQDDNDEKNKQLQQMGEIYTKAHQTVVWLGADESREKAIRYLERAARRQSLDTRTTLESIAPIFWAEWFTRLWVVQEVALAEDVTMVAGNNSIPMTDLVEVLGKMRSDISEHQDEDLFPIEAVCNFQTMVQFQHDVRQNRRRGKAPYVLELFRETEWFQMTVPNDRLYALYGLTGGIHFPVNSDRRYCHQKMFVDFAVWALKEFSGLALLSYTRAVGGRCQCKVPSWAPCYDMEYLPISLLHVSHFNACGCLFEPKYKFQSPSELQIAGAIIDTIKSVCDDGFNYVSLEAQSQALESGAKFAGCEDLVGERYKKYCAALLLELDAENGRASQSLIDLMDERIKNGSSPEYQKAKGARTTWARFRCLCTTVGDRFVWAPRRNAEPGRHDSNTKPGDKICIFKGGRVPYVIRRRTDGSYTLVGECWVQGLMEGEAVEAPDFKHKLQDIVLK